MKYKKYSYILVLILMLVVGITPIYAKSAGIFGTEGDKVKTCYYMNSDSSFKTRLDIHWKLVVEYNHWYDYIPSLNYDAWKNWTPAEFTKATVDKAGGAGYENNDEYVVNWFWSALYVTRECIPGSSVCFGWRYSTNFDANGDFNNYAEPSCPNYLVFQDDGSYYWLWATDSKSKAQEGEEYIRSQGNTGFYGSLTTADEYWKEEVALGIVEIDDGEVTCADYETIFGDPKDDGETYDPDGDGQSSIRYLINIVLQYVRIIVPILVIVLGILDFAKAVMAGKEDNMRKARSDFIKRVLMGVAVFFVPLLVDLIMDLADIVWNGSYPNCGL